MKTTSYQLEPLIRFLCLSSKQSDQSLMIISDNRTDNFKKLAKSKIHGYFMTTNSGEVIKSFSCPLINSSKDK